MFELGEDLFDRIEVRAVWRQEQEPGSRSTDGLAHGRPFVAGQIVHDDDVAGQERWHEQLLDIVGKALSVDRLIEDARGIDPVASQSGEESHRAPMAVGHLGMEPLTDRCPAAQGRHVGLRPGLVDEDKPGEIKLPLILLPLHAPARDCRPKLLGGQHAFF